MNWIDWVISSPKEIYLLIITENKEVKNIDLIDNWVGQYIQPNDSNAWLLDKSDELAIDPTDGGYVSIDDYKGYIYYSDTDTFEERPISEINKLAKDKRYYAVRDIIVPMTKKEWRDCLKQMEEYSIKKKK